MTFRWRYLDASGTTPDGAAGLPDEEFDDQQQAEDWFGGVWEDLRAAGVDAVVLLDGETPVYGPMSLHEA